jgi:hypothetical protein
MSGTRVTIELPDDLHKRLAEASRRSGESIDALIPRLLAHILVRTPASWTLLIEPGTGGGPALLEPLDRSDLPVLDPPLSQTVIEEREDRF